jgi:hypothetical protein
MNFIIVTILSVQFCGIKYICSVLATATFCLQNFPSFPVEALHWTYF